MIKSMTGFGRSEVANDERKIIVEMKSVNHRYCDINLKIPKKLGFFESNIRNLLKNYMQRGKVDIFITYEDFTENQVCVRYNESIASEYYDYLQQMSNRFQIENDITVSRLSSFPDVFALEEQSVDEEKLWKVIEEAMAKAAKSFVASRSVEGEHLLKDLLDKLNGMENVVAFVESRFPQMIKEYHTKLEDKVKELLEGSAIDESRIATEVTIYADKICVDEETVRLKSHMDHMKQTLLEGGSVGRKLDFIAQEMNREANTILSKANDIEISNAAIDLKTEIEKIREQIQNIE